MFFSKCAVCIMRASGGACQKRCAMNAAAIVNAISARLAQLVAKPSTMQSPPIVSTRAPSHASIGAN